MLQMDAHEEVPMCDITTFVSSSFQKDQPQRSKRIKEIETKCLKKFLASESSSDADYKSGNKKFKKSSAPKSISNTLSEYEKMAMKNREEKLAFLKALKFDEVKNEFAEAVSNLEVKYKPKKRPCKPRERQVLPPRKSLRLQNVNIDLSEEAVAAKNQSENLLLTKSSIKKEILPAELPFREAFLGEDTFEGFSGPLCDFSQGDFKPLLEYESHFQDMHLPETQIAKVVPNRITAMDIHPMQNKIVVAAASKHGKVGLWGVNTGQDPYVFEPHLEGITHLRFHPLQLQMIVTCSYDGTLRCGDLEATVFHQAYVSEETSCTHFDFLSSKTYLVAHKNGDVSVVDYRVNRKNTPVKNHECHDSSVKSISVHPVEKTYFLSAGLKGELKLWDLRKLQKHPVLEIQHHKRCVHSALFSPLTGKYVLTTSADDTMCLFDSSNLGKIISFQKSLRHNNQTGRWLTNFRSQWLPNSDNAFVVGSMQQPRKIEIYDSNLKNIFNFTHENLNSITSVNRFHPSLPVLAGANSSGKIYVFSKYM